MWVWFLLVQQPMSKREMLPLLLLHFRVVEITFPIQQKEEKKTKSNHWSIPKLTSYGVGIKKILFLGSGVSSPNRHWSSSLGGTCLFIFLSDPWLSPPEFFVLGLPCHLWNGSWVLDPSLGLPAQVAHFLPENDLGLTAYSKLFWFKVIAALAIQFFQ